MSKNKKQAVDWHAQLSGLRGKVRQSGDTPIVTPDLTEGTAEINVGSHTETVGLSQGQIDEFASNQMQIQKEIAKEKRSEFFANCAIAVAAVVGTLATAYGAYKATHHNPHTSV